MITRPCRGHGPLRARAAAFLGDERGASATLEFAVIILPLLMIVMSVFEIGISYFTLVSAQKAAQIGARAAIVSGAVHSAVPLRNQVDVRYGDQGDSCYQPSGLSACVDPGGPWICNAALNDPACNAERTATVLQEMRRVYTTLRDEDVTVAYRYLQLGYAGGPFVPEVEVTIGRRPMPYQLLSYLSQIEIRAVSASAVGEHMAVN